MSLGSDWSPNEWPGIEKHPQLQQNESIDKECDSETMTAPVSDDDDDGDDDDTWSKSSVDDSISLPISDDAPLPPAPTGELTIASILAPGVAWHRRAFLISAVLAINVGLPFINGIMLGFGEIFARAFIAPCLGLAPPVSMNRFSASPADVPALPIRPWSTIRAWLGGVFSTRSL